MRISWIKYLSSSPKTPSQLLSPFLLYNNYIKIEEIHFENLPYKNINFLSQLFENDTSYHGSISKINMK